MASENDPVIAIEYWDDSWKSLAAYAKRLTVKDAGILNVPMAEILLNNKAGYWTVGANKIPDCAPIRITADVRGAVDTIFQGYYLRHEGHFTRRKHDVTIKCKSYAAKLLWDTITYPYYQDDLNRGVWTMKDVIEDLLGAPDSGHDTGVTLVTDSGDILTERPVDNFERKPLLDALRSIAEELNYDGYIYDAPPNLKLNFKEVGTVQANPSITLAHPFLSVKPIYDTEEIRNFILPWGDIETGYPPSLDRWTEIHNRWANLWTADANCVVSTSAAAKVGVGSIKVTNEEGSNVGVTLDISQDPLYPYIDCSTGRFSQLPLWLYSSHVNQTTLLKPTTDLTDDLGAMIRRGPGLLEHSYPGIPKESWKEWWQAIGPEQTIRDTAIGGFWNKDWFYVTGSSFSWKVKKIRIWMKVWTAEAGFIHLDGLHFRGGVTINPLTNTSYYPVCPVKDETSIGLHQRRVRHIEDREITTFAQATLAAQRELAALTDPMRKIKVKKGAKPWAKPHQYLVLTLPEYDITSEYWRILELQHDWQAKGNILRTTFSLVPYTAKVSTTAIQLDEIGGLVK